jgi:hypothetical protein
LVVSNVGIIRGGGCCYNRTVFYVRLFCDIRKKLINGEYEMEKVKDVVYGGIAIILSIVSHYIFSETTQHGKDIAILQNENKNIHDSLSEIKADLKFIRQKLEE